MSIRRDAIAIVASAMGILVLALTSSDHGLEAQSQAPREQTNFRASVDIVRVEVAVLDKQRRPVRGLGPEDFEVVDEGSRRPVVAFAQVDVPPPPPRAPESAAWIDDVPRDVAVNQSRDLRRIAIVMDDAMTPPDPRTASLARSIARGIVERLGPGDEAAVVFTMFSRASQGFTSDRARLMAAIDGFQPRYSTGAAMTADFVSPQAAITSLRSVTDFLLASRDRRKAVAFISPGAPIDVRSMAPGVEEDRAIRDWQDLLRHAARSNVTIYGYDPTGLSGVDQGVLQTDVSIFTPAVGERPSAASVAAIIRKRVELQREFLFATAENTGGQTISRTDNVEPAIDAMFDELGTHYLLGFTPADGGARGTRRLQVRVLRPDVVVRAAGAYDPATANPSEADALSRDSDLERVLRATTPATGVSLHLTTAALAVPDKSASDVTRVAVIVGVDLPLDAGGAMTERAELLVRAYGPSGDPRGSRTAIADLQLRATAASRTHYEVMTDLDLRPGRHELRVALYSRRQNRTGSVFHSIDVPDFSQASLALSDVVLSTTPALRAATANAFVGLLPVQPTSSRAFPQTIQVSAMVRVYRPAGPDAELPVIRTTLTDATGSIVMDRHETIDLARLKERGAADLQVRLPVRDLEPGEYLFRVEASAAGHRATRTARFMIVN